MESNRKPGGLEKFQVTDREECGLIIRRNDDIPVWYVVKLPNHAADPNDYEIWSGDVDMVRSVLAEEEVIVGFMHTHLARHDCSPSDRDFEGAALHPEMEHLIYQPATHRWVWYGPEVLAET